MRRLGIIAAAAQLASGGGGPTLLPLSTPILFEGDSNTAPDYSNFPNWPKRARMYAGGRYYLPAGGNFAVPGAVVSTATGGANSMQSRKDAVVSKIAQMVALAGECIVWFQIGTNGDGGGGWTNSEPALIELVAAYRAAGARVYANTCPTFGASVAYFNSLNAWLMTPGNVDGYVDVNTFVVQTGGTHYDQADSDRVGAAVGAYLAALAVSTSIYSDPLTNVIAGGMTGTGGNPGANATGQLADGWTCARTIGDGTATLSKVTLAGNPAQRLSVTAGASGTYFRLSRSDATTLSTGDTVDGWATVQIVSATDSASILHAGISIAGGTFPSNSGSQIDPANWAIGPQIWRVSPVSQASGGSSLASQINLYVAAGKTAVIDVADMRGGIRESSSAVLPANTVAPVMSALAEGGSLACTDGTWTGTPTPTLISKQFYIGSTPVSSSYVPVTGDVGAVASCFVTYGNLAGNVSAVSNSVTITSAPANWWSPTSDDSIDWDFAGDRYRYNGTSYASVATLLSASGSTFARELAAYYTDSAGAMTLVSTGTLRRGDKGMLYEASSSNVCTRSEDSGFWTVSGTSKTADNLTSPAGSSTADTIYELATTAAHNVQKSITVTAGQLYRAAVLINAVNITSLQIRFTATGVTNPYRNFDLTGSGALGSSGGTGFTNAGIERLGSGVWYRCWVEFTPTGTSATWYLSFNNNNTSAALSPSYLGDVAKAFGVWGAQLEPTTLTSYIPTTTAAVTRPADALSIVLPTGTHDLTVTFDDDSTQALTGLSGTYALPTTLNRPYIKRITGDRTA